MATNIIVLKKGYTRIPVNTTANQCCPECNTKPENFNFDDIRYELTCTHCGLVLAAPPAYVAGHIKIKYPFHELYPLGEDVEQEYGTRISAYDGKEIQPF